MSPAEPLRILLVDDDRVLSKYHGALLEAAGFSVRHVSKPSEALDIFVEVDPDLVIVDYHMPEMTGPELASRIRATDKSEAVGILLITADEHAGTVATAIRQGISSHLKKPLDQELFPAMCQSLAETSRKTRRAVRMAETASRHKSEFLASMSHELRTPLNAVLGFAQLLGMDSDLPAGARDNAGEIERAGRHLLALVNDLIDLARIEAGKLEMSLEPVEVRSVVVEALSLMMPMARDKGIELIDETGTAQAVVRADYIRLRQVAINFLSNAIKYNKRGGSVRIACRENGDRVRLSLSDTGPGIPADKQERIFNAFDRLGQEGGGEEGTGIGLVITKRIAEAMGGRVGFESTEGAGSTFWIELQAATPATVAATSADATPAAPQSMAKQRLSVIYVEDNPANQRLMQQVMSSRSHIKLRIAPSAEEGLDMIHADPPTLVFMDINLPGMNGFEALALIKADARTAGIPVVAVSANVMPRDIAHGREAGFADYLTKPVDVAAVLKILDTLG